MAGRDALVVERTRRAARADNAMDACAKCPILKDDGMAGSEEPGRDMCCSAEAGRDSEDQMSVMVSIGLYVCRGSRGMVNDEMV